MKKILLLTFSLSLILSVSSFASSNEYRIDDEAVEAVFENSVAMLSADAMFDIASDKATLEEKNVWIAVLLDFFLGGLAIHRVYLGGKPVLIVGYLLTCFGIFGIVPLIDLIVLVINNDDISQYVDNDKFFMW